MTDERPEGETMELPRPKVGAATGPLFQPGEVLAGRYRIDRFLGAGASGEVYAASDNQLATSVALKALLLGRRHDTHTFERFKREILLARRVSHPNVCRIFDLGSHAPPGSAAPVHFLTMELLEGETLQARIEEGGRFEEAEAVPIVRQVAAALAAAHGAGIVHRDLKSSNILLVGEGAAPRRAVVTDFGLARETQVDSSSLTMTGGVVGTPAYMAPEQVEGRTADARSDIYALGVVLYEMLSGHLPFEGGSPLSVAARRLRKPPTPLESFRPDLSERARAVVGRCLEREAAARFPSALDVARAFEGEIAARRRRPWRWIAGLAAFGLVGALSMLWLVEPPVGLGSPDRAMVAAARPSFAVLGLRDASDRAETAWLGSALGEMLTTELAAGGSLRAVPGETVSRVRADLALAPSEALAPDSLARLGRALAADLVLLGAYTALGAEGERRIRLDLRLQRTDGGGDLPLSVEGSEQELFDLAARAGEALRGALGLRATARTEAGAELRALLPSRGDALRLYSEGLDRLRAGDALAARERFEAALVEEPDSALTWEGLARAWQLLGYDERALGAAREAAQRAPGLPRAEAMRVEARLRLAERDWERAIELHRALWRFYPDDPEGGLELANALLEADRSGEASTVVAELRRLPAPARDDPRIDLAAARAADGVSDYRLQLEAARAAAAKAASSGARSLLARAGYEEGLALRRLGELDASHAALTESRRLAAAVGDRSSLGVSLQALANLERSRGRLDEAAALFAEARAIFGAIGSRQREARAELAQGLLASERGDLDGALELYLAALDKLREVGDRRGAAAALSNVGTMLSERGDLAGALARHEEAIAEFRAIGDEARIVVSLQNIAQIRLERGDLDGARRALDEELTIARQLSNPLSLGYALKARGELAAEAGDIASARTQIGEARGAFEQAGNEPWQLLSEMALATVALQAGDPAGAAVELERLARAFEAAGMADDGAEAQIQRLRALIAAGDEATARSLAGPGLERAERDPSQRLRHLAAMARAELEMASGRPAEAQHRLERQARDCDRAGLALLALEARSGAALAARAAGAPEAEELLGAARAEAERLGSGRLSRRLGASPNAG